MLYKILLIIIDMIKYYVNDKWTEESFKNFIKNFNTSLLLQKICKLSAKCHYDTLKQDLKCVLKKKIPLYCDGGKIIEHEVWILPWDLLDISYQAIKYSKKYIDIEDFDDETLYTIATAWSHTKDKLSEKSKNYLRSDHNIEYYLFGMSEEQRIFQDIYSVFSILSRDYYILFKSSKKIKEKENKINIKEIIKKEIGLDIKSILVNILLIGYFGFLNPVVYSTEDKYINPFLDDKYKKIIDYYSADLEWFRKTKLGRQALYAKPIVSIDKNNILANVYLPFIIYKHSLFWIARNYYLKTGSEKFVGSFGLYFEKYFEELLETYVEKENYNKLEKLNKRKIADWRISLGKYNFIIEQKSSFLKLACKQQDPNIKNYKEFLTDNISEAIEQLKSTEKILNDGLEYYKIVLLYDESVPPNFMKRYFELCDPSLKDKEKFWIISIHEMEELLYMYKHNNDIFENVINKKILNEDVYSFTQIFSNINWETKHISQKKYFKITKKVHKAVERKLHKLKKIYNP